MKFSVVFLLIFNSFLFSQIKVDSVILSDKANLENLNNYREKLSKNKLDLSYHMKFSGIFHRNGDKNPMVFTGKAEYKNDLFLNNIHFSENIKKEEETTLYNFFNQIYNLAYTYYSFSQDKNSILNDFYCIQNENDQWNFKVYNKNTKGKYNKNISNRMSFEIALDKDGMVRHIFIFSDASRSLNKSGKVPSFDYIEIHLGVIDKKYKIEYINGNIINPTTNEKIMFNINFE
jgi:hypothetical protein